MSRRSPFEFDISVSADNKRRARRRGMTGAVETSMRKCEHEGCTNPGKYRAPKSPDNLDEFVWFCLDHIREYNQKWNFFENHSQAEFEEELERDRVWGRTTKPFKEGADKASSTRPHGEGKAWQRFGFDDPYDILGDNATINPAKEAPRKEGHTRRLPPTERKALEILGARDTMTRTEIRKVYKSLVKVLHPDTNAGSRDDEEKLAEVVWAWEQIKGSRSFKD